MHMKPLTLYVSDEVYSLYQTIALKQKTKAAALIRDAMTSYLEKLQKKKTLDDFRPFDSGEIKNDFINPANILKKSVKFLSEK